MALGRDQAAAVVGAVLNGQWRLVRLIGEGGLAAVFEAEGLQGQGQRAIKLLHAQFLSQPAIVERFYAEAKASFSLRHQHIATVEAYAYAEDGSPYLVMELLAGQSLDEHLRSHLPMPPEQAAPILYGVLQALAVAHAHGIVHRDLKPANLFLCPQPNGELAVKVLDFGVAKVLDAAGGMGSKTRTGAVLGTPGYMSPEQVKNAKTVDARTDLWAAGVVLYEMMTHHHPFGSDDPLSRMLAVLRDEAAPITEVAPHLAGWKGFFARALARDPNDRFQSAEEMAEALRQLAQGAAARFVPDGLQTVAIPLMADMRVGEQAGPVTVRGMPSAAPRPSAQPAAAGPGAWQQGQPSAAAPPVGPSAGVTGVGSLPTGMPKTVLVAALPGPVAGSAGASHTQISVDRPEGTPTIASHVPHVAVVTAAPVEVASLVWWGVVLVAIGSFAAGVLLGYLLGA